MQNWVTRAGYAELSGLPTSNTMLSWGALAYPELCPMELSSNTTCFLPSRFSYALLPCSSLLGLCCARRLNIPWLPPPSSPNHSAPSSGPNSPTLGKHSRDESTVKQNNSEEEEAPKEKSAERCLWIPKTLRIDDPGEAARSSIWATLGIKNDKADSLSGGGLFKAFQPKGDQKNHLTEASPVLQANPAALSRSLNFQESS
ncbi:hypothetical protein GBA52_025833 [Prunus armeniaca]|nr:hypothetical protein GBA52_025833 [Prunus armeniaca]